MRLAVCVAILGEMPDCRDKVCVPPEKKNDERPMSPEQKNVHRSSLRVHRAGGVSRS